MNIPHPSKDNPLVSMGPCPEILLEDRTITFRRPYPRMAMTAHGNKPAIFIFRGAERPGAKEVPEKVIRRYERFNNRKVRSVRFVDLELDGWEYLGKCKGEVYMSDKEGMGSGQEYCHEHEGSLPDIYVNKDGTAYVITGGNFTIDEWIEG